MMAEVTDGTLPQSQSPLKWMDGHGTDTVQSMPVKRVQLQFGGTFKQRETSSKDRLQSLCGCSKILPVIYKG